MQRSLALPPCVRTGAVRLGSFVAIAGIATLAGCAPPPPNAPSVMVLPPPGKNFGQFRQEDASCRQYADQAVGYRSPSQVGTQSAAGSALLGTGVGAAAGAALGAAGGNAGLGAAIGAGTGLLFGSAIGAGNAQASAGGLQQRYDGAYLQCMTADGNQIAQPPPGSYGPPPPPAYAAYPAYGPPVAYPAYYGSGIVVVSGGWHRHY